MKKFSHEKLDVYQYSIEFIAVTSFIINDIPKGKSYITDQLQRAASSISLNIAEGAGEFSRNEKARFYRIAKRSATECAAILDLCSKLNDSPNIHITRARNLLFSIVSMLTRLIKNYQLESPPQSIIKE